MEVVLSLLATAIFFPSGLNAIDQDAPTHTTTFFFFFVGRLIRRERLDPFSHDDLSSTKFTAHQETSSHAL